MLVRVFIGIYRQHSLTDKPTAIACRNNIPTPDSIKYRVYARWHSDPPLTKHCSVEGKINIFVVAIISGVIINAPAAGRINTYAISYIGKRYHKRLSRKATKADCPRRIAHMKRIEQTAGGFGYLGDNGMKLRKRVFP